MDLTDVYVLDDLVARERLRGALLVIGMAGVGLLFLRSGVAKMAGAMLIIARVLAMPMTGREWILLGSIALIGAIALIARRGEERAAEAAEQGPPEAVEPDDAREPAPCPACHAVIPSGHSRCPSCGWSYAADVS